MPDKKPDVSLSIDRNATIDGDLHVGGRLFVDNIEPAEEPDLESADLYTGATTTGTITFATPQFSWFGTDPSEAGQYYDRYNEEEFILHNGDVFVLRLADDALDLDWVDITSEKYRRYIYADGTVKKINDPVALCIASSGSHRIVDAAGFCHYVPTGWQSLMWTPWNDRPHFVK